MANRKCVECNVIDGRPRNAKRRRAMRENDPVMAVYVRAKWRANSRGTPFLILPGHIKMPDVCPCCHKEFVLNAPKGHTHPQTPSLDRVDSRGGYVLGNVAIICNRCNHLKNDGTVEEHLLIADWMLQHAASRERPTP